MAAFQHYTDSHSIWTIGSHHGLRSVTEAALTNGRICLKSLEEFITNKNATFDDYNYNEESNDYDSYYMLCKTKWSG